jgi:hypothetical protein
MSEASPVSAPSPVPTGRRGKAARHPFDDHRRSFHRHYRPGDLLTIVVPLIAFAVLTWTFSSAVVRGLDVVVVDADRSELSAQLIQSIASAPV